ncbi:hypothetical protein FB446DRAFT_841600 [Lentinula raphanica]|uniref:DUF6534 domain-containing protein n=1 Tax=Lentinula raphanica TaxID=153919 RepID=A0AA38UGD5_9AGAR|nr:hypothetical protein FB446DRAFT_841600 [Lentinula raphanica]KAJ3818865.1 hypothetical protein F5880DRAFT_1705366 [Lentinula raphanica]KAJ3840494.1 hypothetical protein F5878DRAFT_67464 [Lentinula raphanica]
MSANIPPNIALIAGSYLLGGVFSYGLFGILVVQIFFYHYTFYERDPLSLKALVYILAFLDLILTVMQTNCLWQVLAQHWGDTTALYNVAAGADATIPFLSGVVSSIAHAFYAWRIYRLMNSKLIPILVMSISLTTCAMAGYTAIKGAEIGIAHFTEMNSEVSTWLGGTVLCDCLITIVLVYQLFRYKRHSASAHFRNTLLLLITLIVETGLVTVLTALADLLLFIFRGNSTLYFIPFFILSKMYSNCLLANLNIRGAINTQTESGNQHPLWIDLDETGTLIYGSRLHSAPPVPSQVHVEATICHNYGDVELVILPDSGQESRMKPMRAASYPV